MASTRLQGCVDSLHNVPSPHLNQVVRHPSLVSSLHPWMLGDFWHDTPFFLPNSPSQGLKTWGLVRWSYSNLLGLHHNNWWWPGCLTSILFLQSLSLILISVSFLSKFSSLASSFPFLMYFSFPLALYLWLAFRSDIGAPTLRCLMTIFSIHNNLFFGHSRTLLNYLISYDIMLLCSPKAQTQYKGHQEGWCINANLHLFIFCFYIQNC